MALKLPHIKTSLNIECWREHLEPEYAHEHMVQSYIVSKVARIVVIYVYCCHGPRGSVKRSMESLTGSIGPEYVRTHGAITILSTDTIARNVFGITD